MRFTINTIFKLVIVFGMIHFTGCSLAHKILRPTGIVSMPLEEIIPKYSTPFSHFIDIDGTIVHYCDEGQGPVLLLLHGVASSIHTWNNWTEILRDKYRLIRIGVPGFGLTGPIASDNYSKEEWVRILNLFVEKLHLDRFSLAGNSMGGFIGWNFAIAYPDKIDKLILIDPVAYPQPCPWIFNLVSLPLVGTIAKYITPKFLIDYNVKEVYGDVNKISNSTYERYFDMAMRPGNRESYVKIFQLMKSKSSSEIYSQNIRHIKAPVLLMWGTEDRWVPMTLIDKWKNDIPHISVITYPGVGHVPMEEIPYITARDAHKFLSGCELLLAQSKKDGTKMP